MISNTWPSKSANYIQSSQQIAAISTLPEQTQFFLTFFDLWLRILGLVQVPLLARMVLMVSSRHQCFHSCKSCSHRFTSRCFLSRIIFFEVNGVLWDPLYCWIRLGSQRIRWALRFLPEGLKTQRWIYGLENRRLEFSLCPTELCKSLGELFWTCHAVGTHSTKHSKTRCRSWVRTWSANCPVMTYRTRALGSILIPRQRNHVIRNPPKNQVIGLTTIVINYWTIISFILNHSTI